jgi:hypothetical protein
MTTHRYGVKTKSGKVIWVQAQRAKVDDGMLLFLNGDHKDSSEVIAGFAIASVDHFGRPEAFVSGGNEGEAAE